jgi:hypothetical protein
VEDTLHVRDKDDYNTVVLFTLDRTEGFSNTFHVSTDPSYYDALYPIDASAIYDWLGHHFDLNPNKELLEEINALKEKLLDKEAELDELYYKMSRD